MTSTINASTVAGIVTTADTSGVLQLQTAGTAALTVDASQNVGIGTTTLTNKFNVAGAIQSSSTLAAIGVNTVALSQESAYSRLAAFGPNSSTAGTLYLYVIDSAGGNQNGMIIGPTGNVTMGKNISVGGATPTTAGTGITFPATQSASSDVNTLDDYEEGTWTPVINPATGTVTSSVVAGTYVKVGRQVTLNYSAQLTGGTITAVSSIGGFPFAVQNVAISASGSCREFYATGNLWSLTAGPSATAANLIKYDNTSACSNIFAWSGTFTYQTST
jgi:hypothetical protein